MNNLIKFSLITSLSTSLFAMSSVDTKVLKYQENIIKQNPAYTLHKLKLLKKEALDKKSLWNAYKLELDITQKSNKKRFKAPMLIFSNGRYITNEMVDMNTGARYGEDEARVKAAKKRAEFEKTFKLPDSYYKKDHLIAGNHNAKTKVVVFSDPLCVFCIKNAPNIIKSIQGRDDIALYYYDFPLDMHPTSKTVIKAMHKAKQDGIKNVELQVYEANYENFYNVYRTKDPKKAIDAFNEIFDTKYTLKDINTKEANKILQEDIKAGLNAHVQGTPTVSFNGSFYNSRVKLKEFLKNK